MRLDHNFHPLWCSRVNTTVCRIFSWLAAFAPSGDTADQSPGNRSPGSSLKRCAAARHAPRYAGAPDVRTFDGFVVEELGSGIVRGRPPTSFPVAIGEGSHPFPFRTRKLSPPPPMVLQAQVCGRVGHCRGYIEARRVSRCVGLSYLSLNPAESPGWV